MSEPDYDFLEEDAPDEVVAESEPETVESNTADAAPAAQAPAATTAPAKEDHVPLAALMAERSKRQEEATARKELERRIAEYEQRQQAPAPTFYENPEAHVQHVAQTIEQRTQQRFYAALEAQALEVYPDYAEVIAELTEQAQDNPALVQKVFSAPNPAIAAYKLGKQLREMKAMEDPAAYRAKVEAEVRAAIAAEAASKEAARTAVQSAIPPELSAARATKDSEVLPDDSLESILASKKR